MSSTPFSHAELQERLPAYLANELNVEEHDAVAAHLMSCATCQAELEEMRQLMALLAKQRPRPITNPSNADAVMTRLASRSLQDTAIMGWNSSYSVPPLRENTPDDALSEQMRRTAPRSPIRMPLEPPRPLRSLVTVIAMTAVVGLLVALLVSHLPLSGLVTPTPNAGDWSAAYLGSNGHLYTVSATGERRMGPVLPGANPQGLPMSTRAGVSTDGHYLAYVQTTGSSDAGPVAVVDLTNGRVTTLDLMANELHWAPNALRFVSLLTTVDFGNAHLSLTLMDIRTNQRQDIPLGSALAHAREARLVGWIDAQHVAIVADRGDKSLTVSLMSLDLATGGIRTLSTLVEAPDVYLSPDGKVVFIAPNYWSASARVVDTATGSTRELPNITDTFAGRFKLFDNLNLVYGGNWAYQWAWRPGTHTIALSLSASSNPSEGGTQPETQKAGVWLIDLDHDQAASLNRDRYPLTWTPDGQALFLSDIDAPSMVTNTGYSVGPGLYVMSPTKPGEEGQLLAADMVAFFGLARSG